MSEFTGFSDHVWVSDATTITAAHAAQFDLERVKQIAADLRLLFESNEALVAIDIQPNFSFRLLHGCEEGDADAVTSHHCVVDTVNQGFDQHYSVFAWGDEGWIATRLRVQSDGDIWLIFSTDDGENAMEVKLRDNWDEWQ